MKEKKITKKDILAFRGYKFYKELDDGSFDIIRLTGEIEEIKDEDDFMIKVKNVEGYPSSFKFSKIKYSVIKEEYTPIKPEGIVSFNIVYMEDSQTKEALRDVMVLMYRSIDLAIGLDDLPFAVCRQSVNDFFSDFVAKDVSKNNLVGVCCTKENCPTNIDFRYLMACSGIQRSDLVNYYKDDTFDDLLECIPVEKYDKVLNSLYEEHVKNTTDIIAAGASDVHEGWCRSLKLLLEINNTMADFNYMNNVIGVDFELEKYLEKKDEDILQLALPAKLFLSEVLKVSIKDTRVITFNYSVDMSKFNNSNYTLIRDNTNKLYLVVYLEEGQFLEDELQAEINKLDVTDRLRLAYYNKYKN